MAASPVTPQPGLASSIVVAGTPITVAGSNPNGGYITNPITAADQGFDPNAAPEPLFIDPTGQPATTQGNGTTFRLEPGQTWFLIPGQTTTTSANAATAGHKFSVVVY
jgi:hypothetical protein